MATTKAAKAKTAAVALACAAALAAAPASAATLRPKSVAIAAGKSARLVVNGISSVTRLSFKSSDPKVAKVSARGVVTGVKAGKATITAKAGKQALKCRVTVKAPKKVHVAYVGLDKAKASAATGKKISLKATAYPADATNRKVRWESSAPKVAKVSAKGVVACLKAGKAKIWAISVSDPRARSACLVTVKKTAEKKKGRAGSSTRPVGRPAVESYRTPVVQKGQAKTSDGTVALTNSWKLALVRPTASEASSVGTTLAVSYYGNRLTPTYQFQVSRSASFPPSSTKTFTARNESCQYMALICESVPTAAAKKKLSKSFGLCLWDGNSFGEVNENTMIPSTNSWAYACVVTPAGKVDAKVSDAYLNAGFANPGADLAAATRAVVKIHADKTPSVATAPTGTSTSGWYVRVRAYYNDQHASGWSNVVKAK